MLVFRTKNPHTSMNIPNMPAPTAIPTMKLGTIALIMTTIDSATRRAKNKSAKNRPKPSYLSPTRKYAVTEKTTAINNTKGMLTSVCERA